jgi:hypothetical protein
MGVGGHLATQGAFFDNHRAKTAAGAVNAGCQARRTGADNHQVCLDLLSVAVGNEQCLLFHPLEREHKEFLCLGTLRKAYRWQV